MLEILINAGVNVVGKDEYGMTQLHIEAHRENKVDNIAIIKILAKHFGHENIDILDNNGNTAFGLACTVATNNIGVNRAEVLINHGAKVDIKVNPGNMYGEIPLLHLACIGSGREGLINLILKFMPKESVDRKDKHDDTPLQIACRHNNWRYVEPLAKAGADVNVSGNFVYNKGISLLQEAYYQHSSDYNVFKALVRAGANLNIKKVILSKHLQPKYKNKEPANLFDVNYDLSDDGFGTPLLHLVYIDKHFDLLDLLLQYKADVNISDPNGMTLLHLVSMPSLKMYEHDNRDKRIQQLIAAGANINAINIAGQTPLHIASSGLMFEMKDLIDNGADMNIKDMSGNTILYLLLQHSYLDRALDDINFNNININATNNHGATIAWMAASRGGNYGWSMLQRLMNKFTTINLNAIANNGENAGESILHLSARDMLKKPRIVPNLIYFGADLNAVNNNNVTALNAILELAEPHEIWSFKRALFARGLLLFKSPGFNKLPRDAGNGAIKKIFTFLWGESDFSNEIYTQLRAAVYKQDTQESLVKGQDKKMLSEHNPEKQVTPMYSSLAVAPLADSKMKRSASLGDLRSSAIARPRSNTM